MCWLSSKCRIKNIYIHTHTHARTLDKPNLQKCSFDTIRYNSLTEKLICSYSFDATIYDSNAFAHDAIFCSCVNSNHSKCLVPMRNADARQWKGEFLRNNHRTKHKEWRRRKLRTQHKQSNAAQIVRRRIAMPKYHLHALFRSIQGNSLNCLCHTCMHCACLV